MGIELHPKFLSLTGTRCYQPLRKSIVAKCCQTLRRTVGFHASRLSGHAHETILSWGDEA